MKKILVLATGGTIASSDDGGGLQPTMPVDQLLAAVSAALPGDLQLCGQTLMQIDSSNMTPDCWLQMASAVRAHYAAFDGFIFTHGTDTMAYSAAALAYLLPGLNKPVLFTGSQYSLADQRTDAVQNLQDALLCAAQQLAGVFIVFDGLLINGTRAVKTKTRSYDAFASVNMPPLATIKHRQIRFDPGLHRQFLPLADSTATELPPSPLGDRQQLDQRIVVIRLFPGLEPAIFAAIKQHYRGVIIESYGIGGISSGHINHVEKICQLSDAGLIVVLTTQCLQEGVDFSRYAVGRQLPPERLVYAGDMTTEALVAKLMVALSCRHSFAEIKSYIETPWHGDLQPS